MGAGVARLSARNGPIWPVVTLSLAPDVAAGSRTDGGASSTSRRAALVTRARVSLTVFWPAALGLAPDAGLTRSYWYPVNASTEPIFEERITAIDLAFIDERNRPTRNYRVRWEGVWFSPRAERVDFHAGADDGVILRVDGDTVLERSPAVGMHTVARTMELEAGAHRLEIEHWQDRGARSLTVQWAPARQHSGAPGPHSSIPRGSWRTRLLAAHRCNAMARPRPAGLGGRGCGAGRADGLASVLSEGHELEPGRAVAPPAHRAVSRRARPQPAPSLRPWTVHGTNRTEFLVGFWELAPGWVWLLGPIVGVLAGLSILMPAPMVPTICGGALRGRRARSRIRYWPGLPVRDPEDWLIGHFRRIVPAGYAGFERGHQIARTTLPGCLPNAGVLVSVGGSRRTLPPTPS